jgi:hypothetical protein
MRLIWLPLLVACGSKNDAKPPPLPAPAAITSGDAAAAKCAALVPETLRAGLAASGAFLPGSATCNFKRERKLALSVMLRCDRGTSLESFENQRPKYVRDAKVGRSGYDLSGRLSWYASQVDCTGEVWSFDPQLDALAFAKAADQAVTAATAPLPGAPSKQAPGLRCDEIAPAALRDRLKLTKRTEQTISGDVLTCRYAGTQGGLLVTVDCGDNAAHHLDSQRDGQKHLGRYLHDVDVGRGGFEEAGQQITFLDPQTDCIVSVAAASDPLIAAREVEAAVTPETLR